ncbi:hypothetical protein M3197_12060 [Sporosarcina aquimarina]|uniref:hypothetical protein n=1 Tax=Sporosarcina aquimarina TaxID=114975 RepID=UPI002040DF48|nr:hypothetical protein [Sporosarcina aquimarina]MCM3758199.1 hypothetical protein [Sporosarcina aquimarina]
MKGQFTKKRISLVTTLALACVIATGCTQQGEANEGKKSGVVAEAETTVSSVKKNIQTVEAVLQQELNSPDEKYIHLADAAMGGREDPESVIQKENEMKLLSYVKEKYQPYFTDEGIERARSTNMLFQYHSQFVFDEEYQIRLLDSEVKQSEIDTASNQYQFTAIVELLSPGEEPSQHELEGRAIFSTKEGKIGDFVLGQKDPTLSKKIFELAAKP